MELDNLTLENFRQFYGEQELMFSQSADENVTLILGSNGSGKTTILNAFLWLFYDDVNMPRADQIVCERAMAEAAPNDQVTVRVRLEFDHENRHYTAERVKVYQKTDQTDLRGRLMSEDLTLHYIDDTGNHQERGNPSSALKQIMPERLREIFFFDGETIDELTAENSQERVQDAIRNIMGLEILERSIRHLDTIEGRFEDEIEKHGSNELAELIQNKQQLKADIEANEEKLSDIKESKRETENELAEVEDRLSNLEDSRELQEQRKHLREDRDEIQAEIDQINTDIAQVISDSGHLPFAMPAVETTARMLQEKRQQGEIPSDIKQTFVDDLLGMNECICGRPLKPGTEPREQVSQWRQRAGSSELEEAAMNIAGRLTEIGSGQEALYDDIDTYLERRSAKQDQKRATEERIDEISAQLTEEVTEDVAELERRRTELADEVEDLTKQIGNLEGDIEDQEKAFKELQDEIDDAREEDEKANLARRRAKTAAYLRDRVESLFEQYQDEVRESVNDRVNDIFQEIIEKEFYAEITDEYALRILKDVGQATQEPVAQSRGERQVASLSFIATLTSLAQERYESDNEAEYFTGGIYPMVMDSPFGALDPTYQERVSKMLPEMAKQVIVLVTESQWSDAVAGEMDHVAANRYTLEYHDPSENPSVEYEYTELVPETGVN